MIGGMMMTPFEWITTLIAIASLVMQFAEMRKQKKQDK
jgi:hypothetical protein